MLKANSEKQKKTKRPGFKNGDIFPARVKSARRFIDYCVLDADVRVIDRRPSIERNLRV